MFQFHPHPHYVLTYYVCVWLEGSGRRKEVASRLHKVSCFNRLRPWRVYMMTTRTLRVKKQDQEQYWEDRLSRMDLEMGRGHVSWIDYGHDVKHLDTDGRKTFDVSPNPGEGEDVVEWPLSLL